MSSFKSPELIVHGNIVKVFDTNSTEVGIIRFRVVPSTSKLIYTKGKSGNYFLGAKSSKLFNQ